MVKKTNSNFVNKITNLNIQKKSLIIFFIISLLLVAAPIRSLSIKVMMNSVQSTIQENGDSLTINSLTPPSTRVFRVAIYDEPNLTKPTYAGPGDVNNNISNLVDILSVNPKIDITLLDETDIFNRELTTAKFDVFIMADNIPREYIVNMVMDFWLAGGGILAFDGSAAYLSYKGILPPEAIGTNGYPAYWTFGTDGYNITTRNPITRNYNLDTTIGADGLYGYCSWDWTALSGSVIASDLIPIAQSLSDTNEISILGYNPTDRGGKVVSIGFDLDHEVIPELDQLIRDAVDWLTPRPKGRIAFDLSHDPWYSIDSWDTYGVSGKYQIFRDSLVSHGYTFDKLYPVSSGDNITSSRLAPYDMLITVLSRNEFSVNEPISIRNWISSGGSLLALSDNPTLIPDVAKLNELIAPLGLDVINGPTSTTSVSDLNMHPTTEGCSSIQLISYGYVDLDNTAYSIWYDGILTNVVAGANEYGNGRVITVPDINLFDNSYIGNNNNQLFLLNIANWLTAAQADTLIYTDWGISPNYYRTPLALALNELGIKYQLTSKYGFPYQEYFNHSLNLKNWKLVIIASPSQDIPNGILDEILEYINSGGYLIMSFWNVDNKPSHPLWPKLGFTYNSTFNTQPPLYLWETEHPIFNDPIDYNAGNFTYGDPYVDDGDNLNVLSNATALAGTSATEEAGKANIILRNDGKTLYNGYLIDEFTGDTDDSAYPDNFELWMNEITFMIGQIEESQFNLMDYLWYIVGGAGGLLLLIIVIAVIARASKKKRTPTR